MATSLLLESLNKTAGNKNIFHNLTPSELVQHTLDKKEGVRSDSGALVIKTGKFTGRSPKDRYIVLDAVTEQTVDWNDINQPFPEAEYQSLKAEVIHYLQSQEDIYLQEAKAGNNDTHAIALRLYAEKPWSALFANNMFVRLADDEIEGFSPEWKIYCAPTFHADTQRYHLRSSNFSIISFQDKSIIIGGSGYTGEIKKGIFSVINYLFPQQKGLLTMHCSANVGKAGDTAVFFGLSGTGKTTLSTNKDRKMIGDDEHVWSETGVFNIEGGCYAKCKDLSAEKEPEIFEAIKDGAILENIVFQDGTNTPDFANCTITQNTRVSYPIFHLENHEKSGQGGHPKNIFFLTCDAFGVLPPVSKLTTEQAIEYFKLGYTAKVAGTEDGVNEPQATFSACYGAPFMPLPVDRYATLLAENIEKHGSTVWLINTGWIGGTNPEGQRIPLKHTRAMVNEILSNGLEGVQFETAEVFRLSIPVECGSVPAELLNPKSLWENEEAYLQKANELAAKFKAKL